jgi:23S rRNA pseudouridine1911/1915/1917 synthase
MYFMEERNDFHIGELVLYKNNQLIAFNKPAGVPVQSDKTSVTPLFNMGAAYCKHPVYVIHRIDMPATGVVLFAKNKQALAHLNNQFKERTTEKQYLVVVGTMPPAEEGTLTHYLKKDGRKNKAFAFDEPTDGAKKAELSYRWIESIERYHLLEVTLHTGRFHQIRAQLAAIGCPIKGDVKYGFRRKNADRSIHLHHWKLSFDHPVSGERELVTAPVPEDTVWQAFEQVW